VPPELGLARRESAAGETNRLDREPADFHLRVRRCFLALAAAEPERWVVLDATATPDELERLGWAALEQRLAAAGR
jgi:dTMP kinase